MVRQYLYLDVISGQPFLTYKGEKRYLNIIGAVASVLAGLIIIGNFIFCLVTFIQGNELKVLTYKEYKEFEPYVNISQKIFFYKLQTSDSVEVDPRLLEAIPTLWISNSTATTVEYLQGESCSKTSFTDEKYKNLIKFDVSTFKCMTRENGENIEIMASKSKYISSYININVAKCKNRTENGNNCYPPEEIDEKISKLDVYLTFSVESLGIDHHSYKEPMFPSYVYKDIPVPTNYKYTRSYELRQYIYESEEGFIFTHKKTRKDVGIDLTTSSSVMYPIDKTFFYPNTYSVFQFSLNQEFAEKYQRSYQSFQTLVANIAGINNFVLLVLQIITSFLIDKYMFTQVAGSLIPPEKNRKMSTSSKTNIIVNTSAKFGKDIKINKENNHAILAGTCTNESSIIDFPFPSTKKKKITLSFWESIKYRFFPRGSKAKFFRKCEELVRTGLGIENILKITLKAHTISNLLNLNSNSSKKLATFNYIHSNSFKEKYDKKFCIN